MPNSKSNLPTKIIPTEIRWLELSGKFPLDMRIPLKILLESNPLKSRILVGRLAVHAKLRSTEVFILGSTRFADNSGNVGSGNPNSSHFRLAHGQYPAAPTPFPREALFHSPSIIIIIVRLIYCLLYINVNHIVDYYWYSYHNHLYTKRAPTPSPARPRSTAPVCSTSPIIWHAAITRNDT